MAWARNGTPNTLGSADSTLSITDLTAKKFNFSLMHSIHSTSPNIYMRYNNDSGSDYAYRVSGNGATDSTSTSASKIEVDQFTPSGTSVFHIDYLLSISGEEKLSIHFSVEGNSTGASNAPTRREIVAKFVPSPDADITEINYIEQDSTNEFLTDSNISALGTD